MKYLNKAMGPLAILIAVYHLVNVFVVVQGSTNHYLTHLAVLIVYSLLILLLEKKGKAIRLFSLFILALTLVSMVYMRIESVRLEHSFGFVETNLDYIAGILLIIAVLGATWLVWGPILPVVSLVCILYFFFGHYLGGLLVHGYCPPEFVMSYLATGISAGIFGYCLPISANYIFLFLVLGGLFIGTRILALFLEIGKAAGNLVRAGPAFTAVIASTLFGMVSGTAVANVTFTGSFTIPAMKERGFKPEYAAAVESAASTGGQVMPPIMGASAFIMAAFIGVPYVTIMLKAFLPAIVYYLLVGFSVYLMCRSSNIFPPKEKVNYGLIARALPVFVLSLAVLIGLLVLRYSAMYAASITIILLLVTSLIQKVTRPSPRELMAGIQQGVLLGAHIAVLTGAIGIICQVILTTGFGLKLSSFLMELVGAQLWPILLMTMVMSIILGVGVPTVAAYILVYLVTVPILIDMGINVFAAHFFCFYFAIFSTLTPPVAVTSLAASKIAGSKWGSTSLQALRLAISAWIIPYVLIFAPELLEFQNLLTPSVLMKVLWLLLAGVSLAMVLYGYSVDYLNRGERAIGFISFLCYFIYFPTNNLLLVILGTIGLGLIVGLPLLRKRYKPRV